MSFKTSTILGLLFAFPFIAQAELNEELSAFTGEWKLDTINLVSFYKGSGPVCAPQSINTEHNTFRVVHRIEPKKTALKSKGSHTIHIQQLYRNNDNGNWIRGFGHPDFFEINGGLKSGDFQTHQTVYHPGINTLTHEMSGDFGWTYQTLVLSNDGKRLTYTYQYREDAISQRCVFYRK